MRPLLLLLLVSGACGGPDEGTNTDAQSAGSTDEQTEELSEQAESPTSAGRQKANVEVVDTDYEPEQVTVPAGATVTWNQTGQQPHSVTSSTTRFDSSPDCSPISTERCLEEGNSFSFEFTEPGVYQYYCRVHGLPDGTGMTGTVVVE